MSRAKARLLDFSIMKKMDNSISIEELKTALEHNEIEDATEFISTGCTLLDYAISNRKNGGVPVGRITELVGENQAGKTLIATHILANTQKRGGIAICIDTEQDMDKTFSARVGVNWDNLIYRDTLSCLEEVFEFIETVIKVTRMKHKDKLVTIVWDSIAATPARKEFEDDYDPQKTVAVHARIMSKGLRKIRLAIKQERITFVCTNQFRKKINISFGDPNTTAHGEAMKYYASVRVRFSRTGQLKEGDRVAGAMTEAKVFKSKVGPPWRTVTFPILYDYGVDNERSFLDYLIEQKIVTGAQWRTMEFNGETLKFRANDWRKLFRENEELQKFVLKLIDEQQTRKLEARQEDIDIDIDSILEVEQVKADLKE